MFPMSYVEIGNEGFYASFIFLLDDPVFQTIVGVPLLPLAAKPWSDLQSPMGGNLCCLFFHWE